MHCRRTGGFHPRLHYAAPAGAMAALSGRANGNAVAFRVQGLRPLLATTNLATYEGEECETPLGFLNDLWIGYPACARCAIDAGLWSGTPLAFTCFISRSEMTTQCRPGRGLRFSFPGEPGACATRLQNVAPAGASCAPRHSREPVRSGRHTEWNAIGVRLFADKAREVTRPTRDIASLGETRPRELSAWASRTRPTPHDCAFPG
jgi:hypothetical protein